MSNSQFSTIAWDLNLDIYNKIIEHPFNQELLNGTLDMNRFCYYIEQDSAYLKDYSKTLASIAAKLPTRDLVTHFIDFAKGAIVAEQESVHDYFRKKFNFKPINRISLACLGYTSYLLKCVATESIEVAIAAVVPCFWVYNEIGKYIKQESILNNPFKKWMDNYASEGFSERVNLVLEIANNYYLNANSNTKDLMLKAFKNSMMWEYRFWDDAYTFNYFI